MKYTKIECVMHSALRDITHQDTPMELRVKAKRYRAWADKIKGTSDEQSYRNGAEECERDADLKEHVSRKPTIERIET